MRTLSDRLQQTTKVVEAQRALAPLSPSDAKAPAVFAQLLKTKALPIAKYAEETQEQKNRAEVRFN